jgi:hypothetical protein
VEMTLSGSIIVSFVQEMRKTKQAKISKLSMRV